MLAMFFEVKLNKFMDKVIKCEKNPKEEFE